MRLIRWPVALYLFGLFLLLGHSDAAQVSAAQTPGYNSAFITDSELENVNAMSVEEVRTFLVSQGSYFGQAIVDVDGQTFDPAQVIVEAAQQYLINPQVILVTLQKESSGVTRPTRPSDGTLRFLMGCVSSSTARDQLRCAAERFRSYHDGLGQSGQTISGWAVGRPKATQDQVTVMPATMAVAGQFTYTPYAGTQWGGNNAQIGGVYLFCHYWNQFGFGSSGCDGQAAPPPAPPPQPLPGNSCMIALDPGHGGPDPGAEREGVKEKDIVWTVANLVKNELAQRGYQSVLTRAEGDNPDFGERWQVAYGANARFLVSIHTNSASSPDAHGTEAWYQEIGINPQAAESKRLAQLLTDTVANRAGLTNRGVKVGKSPFSGVMPAALIELAFLSNANERAMLVNDPALFANAVTEAIVAYGTTVCGVVQPPTPTTSTVTVLVFDTSGSMRDTDMSGDSKLRAAQKAGRNILDIIAAENQAQTGTTNQVGIAHFDNSAQIAFDLSTDIAGAQVALDALQSGGSTAMADGLETAVAMLDARASGDSPIIILLSDGLPNIGLGSNSFVSDGEARQQVLDLATSAGQKGYCVYTVGFGQPGGSIDEGFLQQVAQNSGCGSYYNAQNATELANVYVNLRHTSTGQVLLEQSGLIAQGEQVAIGTIAVPANQGMMLMTLNWPGSQLDPILTDPNGRTVDANYPGATVNTQSSIASIIVNNPRVGSWQLAALGVDVPEGTTTYHAVASVRPSPPTPLNNTPLWLALGGLGLFAGVMWAQGRRGTGWYVRVEEEGFPLQTVSIGRAGVWVGRSGTCQVRLHDPAVSRRHCWIGPTRTHLQVRDNNSQLGTQRNGEKVALAGLSEADEVRVGKARLQPIRKG